VSKVSYCFDGDQLGLLSPFGCCIYSLDYAGPEILLGEKYAGPPQDVWAFGIVSYVLVTGECPFSTASEAAAGLAPNSKALLALEERCGRSVPHEVPPLAAPLAPTSLYSFTSSTELAFSVPPYAEEYNEEKEHAKAEEGREEDGGGRLADAAALIKACLQVDISRRPTFETILSCRYLSGSNGWVNLDEVQGAA
jgi:protein-serine/threonine kinase